ncbi:MAG: lipoprotein signal peptidase [Flavobacteriales bacterium]|nr:lipoprotein signal peptidase [Flavobacteriales bacterium]MCX7769100.1 lipoprotein signal peptidase [Flavobacteriales bacterium]MDW8410937.1 lipoprotein signal peptidase [Flavobacteriales bacterium]
MRKALILLIIFGVLLLDQCLKVWVKTTFTLGESRPVIGSFFQLHFLENYGMAFGLELGGQWGKILLSLFRLGLIGILIHLLIRYYRAGSPAKVLASLSLILAGAIGNVIDSAFYGLLFSASDPSTKAVLFPAEGGYGSFLQGRVVDMFYFEIIRIARTDAPSWFPEALFGPDGYFVFFRPVFNVADASITCGVVLGLLFRRSFHLPTSQPEASPENSSSA